MLHALVLLRAAFTIITQQNKMGGKLEDYSIQAITLFTNLSLVIIFDFYILCSQRLQKGEMLLPFSFVSFSQYTD